MHVFQFSESLQLQQSEQRQFKTDCPGVTHLLIPVINQGINLNLDPKYGHEDCIAFRHLIADEVHPKPCNLKQLPPTSFSQQQNGKLLSCFNLFPQANKQHMETAGIQLAPNDKHCDNSLSESFGSCPLIRQNCDLYFKYPLPRTTNGDDNRPAYLTLVAFKLHFIRIKYSLLLFCKNKISFTASVSVID